MVVFSVRWKDLGKTNWIIFLWGLLIFSVLSGSCSGSKLLIALEKSDVQATAGLEGCCMVCNNCINRLMSLCVTTRELHAPSLCTRTCYACIILSLLYCCPFGRWSLIYSLPLHHCQYVYMHTNIPVFAFTPKKIMFWLGCFHGWLNLMFYYYFHLHPAVLIFRFL